MVSVIVSTEEFWKKMCSPSFIRLGPHKGRIGNVIYHTFAPPEKVEGFLLVKVNKLLQCLSISEFPNKSKIKWKE
jgi:hypothetical protein